MGTIKRRGAVYGVIGLMLCVAVYLNWSYFQAPEELSIADHTLEDTETSGRIYGEVTAVDSEVIGENGEGEATQTSKTDYFAQARLSRQTARDEALTLLKETAADEKADNDAKEQAAERITEIAGDTVKEERAESRIKAKGYEDAVVYIAEDAVSVVVAAPKEGLQNADAAAIAEIIVDETGASADEVRISEAK